jgi:prophage tail gpP-like protein
MNMELRVNGKRYSFFESLSVTTSLDAISAGFSISTPAPQNREDIPLKTGDSCQLLFNGGSLVTGFLEKKSIKNGSSGTQWVFDGRDRTADLADCSIEGAVQFKKQSLSSIVKQLVSPYGIKVAVETDGDFAHDAISLEGDTKILDALRQMASARGVLLIPDGFGGLRITRNRFPLSRVGIKEGVNYVEGSFDKDESKLFSSITVMSQDSKKGNHKVTVRDPNVKRHRPLVIKSDQSSGQADAYRTAQWELATRRAKATQLSVTVDKWVKEDGNLWRVGERVPVDVPKLDVKGVYVVADASFTYGNDGSKASLTLEEPAAYEIA